MLEARSISRWLILVLLLGAFLRGCAEREGLSSGEPCARGCEADPCAIELACCVTAGSEGTVCAPLAQCVTSDSSQGELPLADAAPADRPIPDQRPADRTISDRLGDVAEDTD